MRRALGRGLSQLVAEQFDAHPTEVAIDAVTPNPRQPRVKFDDAALSELADSIRRFGVVQPLLVKPIGDDRYELIAGERRLRAAKLAGLTRVPVVVRAAGDQTSLEISIVENVQRADINAVECARAYRRLMDEFGLTQEQVAEKVGKSRTAIANVVRLLRLPKRALEAVESGAISEGHARALLSFESDAHVLAVLDRIIANGLTVRDVEELAKRATVTKPEAKPAPTLDPNLEEIQRALSMRFGSPTRLIPRGKGGKLVVEYYSDEDLERLMETLGLGD